MAAITTLWPTGATGRPLGSFAGRVEAEIPATAGGEFIQVYRRRRYVWLLPLLGPFIERFVRILN